MGSFRVYLDTVQYTNIADIDQAEVTFERGKTSKGFFIKYMQKVRLCKDAYDYAYSRFLDTGGCGDIAVLVEYKCSDTDAYETLIEGSILLNEIEFDEKLCVAIADIDDNSVNQLFVDYANYEVDLESAVSLNGEALPNIRREIQNFFKLDGTIQAPKTVLGVDLPSYGFELFDSFDKILFAITDGRLRLRSDFLSTYADNKIYQVIVDGTPANTKTVTFNFTRDMIGDTQSTTVTSNGVAVDFADRTVYALADMGYYTTYSIGGSEIVFTIEMNGIDDVLDTVTTDGASTFTIEVLQAYAQGAKAVYLSSGNFISYDVNAEKRLKISFEKLFDIADKLYDLSFDIEYDAGQYYLRIEPLEYFFDNAVAITLNNVPEIKIKPDKERTKSSVRIGGAGIGYYFDNLSCGGQIDKLPDAITLQSKILAQVSGASDEGDEYYIIEGKDLGGAYDEPRDYVKQIQGVSPAVTENHFMNNLVYGDKTLLKYHLFFLPDSPLILTVPVGFPKQFLSNAEFEYPLSFTQFKTLTGYSQIAFNKYSDASTERLGYIDDMKYSIKTGMATFNLIVK